MLSSGVGVVAFAAVLFWGTTHLQDLPFQAGGMRSCSSHTGATARGKVRYCSSSLLASRQVQSTAWLLVYLHPVRARRCYLGPQGLCFFGDGERFDDASVLVSYVSCFPSVLKRDECYDI